VIVGVGLDVVETAQIERLLTGHGQRFAERVFTDAERRACSGRVDAVQAFAARFAAKEACFKALGTGLGYGMSFLHVEVVRANGGGAPELRLTGPAAERARERGVRRVHVSLSHQPGIAAATVILED
jgi:holo-[acyl-carrier protein] synthase